MNIILGAKRTFYGEALGILSMIIGVSFYSFSEAATKLVANTYPAAEILFFRNFFSLILLILFMVFKKDFSLIKTSKLSLHLLRATLAGVSLFFSILSLSELKLSTFSMIFFLSPVLIAIGGILILKEKSSKMLIFSSILGLCGVALIMQPGSDAFSLFGLMAFGSALLYASSFILFKNLSEKENKFSLIFYYVLVCCVGGFIFMWDGYVHPSFQDLSLIILMACLHLIGFYLLIEAIKRVDANILSPFEYFSLIWAIILGYLFWSEVPSFYALGGAFLILLGNFLLASRKMMKTKLKEKEVRQCI